MEYQPLNYETWDFSGKGKNLIGLLNDEEIKLWNIAFPYQDKRQDEGHAETVVYFAAQLLKFIDGERKVVIPAAIFHDTGYSLMNKVELDLFNEMIRIREESPDVEKAYEPVIRARHQYLGAKFAREKLKELGYSSGSMEHILKIISEHDTRRGFYSVSDGIVRDADKLWRFTFQHWLSFLKRKWSFNEFAKNYDDTRKEAYFFSPASKEIAEIEYKRTLKKIEGDRKKNS